MRLAPAGDGVISMRATHQPGGRCDGHGGRVPRAGRASATSASASARTRSTSAATTSRSSSAEGPYQPEERPFIAGVRAAAGLPPARRRDVLPDARGCSRPRATACCSTTPRRRCSTSAPSAPTCGRPRSRRRGSRFRVFAGPRPADVLERFTARDRPPAGRRRAVDARRVVAAAPATTTARAARRAAPRGRPDLASPRRSCTTCRARTTCADREAPSARATARSTRAGPRSLAYFNPMVCTSHPPYGEAARATRWFNTDATGPAVRRTATRPPTSSRSPRSTSRAARRAATSSAGCCARRSTTATTAGWRTSASTRRSTRASPTARPGRRCTTATRRSTTATATEQTAAVGRPIANYVRSGWTGHGALRARSSGAATRRPTGASTACGRRCATALTMGLSRRQQLGLGHRRLLLARRAPADARAVQALDPVRRGVGRDADASERDRAAARRTGPQVEDEDVAADLAPLREAAHAALPVPRSPPTPSTSAPGCRSCAHLALAYPDDRALVARRGRVPVRPRPARRAGDRSRARRARASTCRRGTGSTCGARRPSASATAGSTLGRRAPGSTAAARVTLPAPLDGAAAARPRRHAAPAAARRRRHARALRRRVECGDLARGARGRAGAPRLPARALEREARGRRRAPLAGAPRRVGALDRVEARAALDDPGLDGNARAAVQAVSRERARRPARRLALRREGARPARDGHGPARVP